MNLRGEQEIVNNIRRAENKMIDRLADIIEKISVKMSNNAKSGHQGNTAHMSKRYMNQTTNLTNSISPDTLVISKNEISGGIFASMEYAFKVELSYPYMFPALQSVQKEFNQEIKKIL